MTSSKLFILISLTSFLNVSLSAVLDMKCTFKDHTNWRNLGYTCDLEGERGAVSALNVNDTFVFTGITEEEKLLVKVLLFRTPNVNFVPREAFTTFPNLNRISIHVVTFDALQIEFFRFFPEQHNITMYDFFGSKMSKIDPEVWNYFKKANYFLFEGNLCLTEEIKDVTLLSRKIQTCFNNYINSNLYLKKVVKNIYQFIDNRFIEFERILNYRLDKIDCKLLNIPCEKNFNDRINYNFL